MSDHQQTPTKEQIRAARRAGFANSARSMGEADRKRITASYEKQDARREANLGAFYGALSGGN